MFVLDCFRIYGAYCGGGFQKSEVGRFALRFKSTEGIVEAGPQLVLQLYIVARNGMNIHIAKMELKGKNDFRGMHC